jgi:hypothetical protein
VAPGHQLGFSDLKAIEVARHLEAISGKRDEPFNFRAVVVFSSSSSRRSTPRAAW